MNESHGSAVRFRPYSLVINMGRHPFCTLLFLLSAFFKHLELQVQRKTHILCFQLANVACRKLANLFQYNPFAALTKKVSISIPSSTKQLNDPEYNKWSYIQLSHMWKKDQKGILDIGTVEVT